MEKAKEILQTYTALLGERSSWDSLWQECADICHPRRATITSTYPAGTPPTRTQFDDNFDSTAQRAADTLARGQASRITPMGSRWFALRPPSELADNPAAQDYYHHAGEIIAQKLYASNYYTTQLETYLDRAVFGTAAKEIVTGPGGKGLHFREFPIGTYVIAENHFGIVDTIARCYRLPARSFAAMFPEATLPESVTKAARDPAKRLQTFEVIHYIGPRLDRDPTKIDSKNKPVASYHILKEGDGHLLAESGFDEFPCAVSRWSKWGESPWGWAPAYAALPEANQANYLEQVLDDLAEKAADPRIRVPDGALKSDIDFDPRGLTFYNPDRGSPEEWLTQGRYDIGKDRANDKRRAIDAAFFTELFNPVSQLSDDATATHVRAIVTEARELFHPIFANMVREDQTPTIRRAFSLLLRSGELPPPPASVYQEDSLGAFIADPDVEMVSQMALALEQNHLARLNDVFQVLGQAAQFDPTVFDYLDTAAAGPMLHRAMGLPSQLVRSPEAIAEVQQARAQAQQMEQAQQATQAVSNLGGVQEAARAADMMAGIIPPGG